MNLTSTIQAAKMIGQGNSLAGNTNPFQKASNTPYTRVFLCHSSMAGRMGLERGPLPFGGVCIPYCPATRNTNLVPGLFKAKRNNDMTNLSIFNFNSQKSIRIISNNNNSPLFVAADVAKALGYKRPNDAVTQFCKGTVKHRPLSTGGGEQNVRVICEPDVYRLIFGSKLKSALKFQNWVFDEVLPSIRQTGTYTAPTTLTPAHQRDLQEAVAHKVGNDRQLFPKVWGAIKSHFMVGTYKDLPDSLYGDAIAFIESFSPAVAWTSPTQDKMIWRLNSHTEYEINPCCVALKYGKYYLCRYNGQFSLFMRHPLDNEALTPAIFPEAIKTWHIAIMGEAHQLPSSYPKMIEASR